MNFNFLIPVSDEVIAYSEGVGQQALGKKIKIHSEDNGIPKLEAIKIAIIGIKEHRNAVNYSGKPLVFDSVRKALYALFPGNWYTNIADLGDIEPGETVEDTYFAMRTAITVLLEKNIIPVILGGSQDLVYANYRAYDTVSPMINIVNIDTNFDLGDANLPIKNNSYVGKIVVEEPYNLFNYSTIGYQTYFNAQEEIDLIEKLYFDAYRLGEVTSNISSVEPLLRDANMVSIDLKVLKASEVGTAQKYTPNGFSGKEICAISRYAGISNKVSSFGIYEYNYSETDVLTPMLIAQSIWYFIEGVNCRVKDDNFIDENYYQKYNVLINDDDLVFFKSLKTGRWWIEIPYSENINNKLKKYTLLPCTHNDYLMALKGETPERWYKAYKKNCL